MKIRAVLGILAFFSLGCSGLAVDSDHIEHVSCYSGGELVYEGSGSVLYTNYDLTMIEEETGDKLRFTPGGCIIRHPSRDSSNIEEE